MRVATWNVNSVRARLPRLLDWLERAAPDVVCLQETKVEDEGFPYEELEWAGYQAVHASNGRWNGVAVLSRTPLSEVRREWPEGTEPWPDGMEVDRGRLITATTAGLRVTSVYVPNGREVTADHYVYKLAWLDRLRSLAAADLASGVALIVAGDVNVAPADIDVYDVAAFDGSTHVTRPERAAIEALVDLGLADLVRDRWPSDSLYTYWDYRAGMFHKNLGMRIDLVLGSPAVRARVVQAWVDRAARKGSQPSDHAPVIVDLDSAPEPVSVPMVPMPSLGR